jgi:hypothetical protein
MRIYKYIFYTFLFLASKSLTAQSISGYVISESGEGIPFSNIFLRERNIGIISDINGHYRLPIDFLEETSDTLIFSSLGYNAVRIPVALFAEKVAAGNTDIVLTANYVLLSEVVVTPGNNRLREYGMFQLRSSNFFLIGRPAFRVMAFVENTDSLNKIIQTVNVRIRRDNNDTQKLRVFFYQKTENGFQNINVADEDIFITDFSSSRIRLDVSMHHILFPKEGIFVGVEWIGAENVIQNRREMFGLSVRTTSRDNRRNTWVFENETWVQFPYFTEEEINEIPRMFRSSVRNANAMIGITAL